MIPQIETFLALLTNYAHGNNKKWIDCMKKNIVLQWFPNVYTDLYESKQIKLFYIPHSANKC